MSPHYGTTRSAHPEARPEEPSAETGTGIADVPVEQFIWKNAAAPAETAAPEGGECDNPNPAPETTDDDEALTRIVVLSEDEEETDDSWRRQLISALHDADRNASRTKAHPAEPPPIPPAEIPRRPPIALVARHAVRASSPLPVERRPRQRMGSVLVGLSAMAGLLTTALPRAANTPETAALAAASETVITGSLTPTAGTDELKPVFVNSPVLVRDVQAPGSKTTVPVGPVIETVRTVPVQIGTRPQAAVPTPEPTSAIEQPTPQIASFEPPPPLPPLDRDGVAALIANKPTAPAASPAAVAPSPPTPAPDAPKEKTASVAPEPVKPAKARTPQVSTAYERSIREKPRAKSASKKRAPTKTASRSSDRAKWDTRRQGLGTSTQVKEVEPSTMVKLLKSLNPFGSKEEVQAKDGAPVKNIFK